MEIKRVVLDDLKEIMKMEYQIFKQDSFSKQTMTKLILRNSLFLKLLSKNSSNIIGYIIAIRDGRDRVNIINFLIKKTYQNKGYGSYLFQAALELIKAYQEIKKIILTVNKKNWIAIRLYQKFNFQIVQEIENYYSNRESAYLMEITL
ncbi:MAG: GNAT family N-acetyltransferase [Candidatus Hodarchaeota archaeon]